MSSAEYEYRIIMLGDPGVGKSTYYWRLKTGKFVDTDSIKSSLVTMGTAAERSMIVDGTNIKAQLYDTGGEERHRSLTHNYYRGVDGVLLTYSVDDHCTLINLRQWIESVEEVNSGEDIESITWGIIGNKCDLKSEIASDTVKLLCEELGTTLEFQTSAKEGLNVVESFEKMVKVIHRHRHKRGAKPKQDIVDLKNEKSGKQGSSSNCC